MLAALHVELVMLERKLDRRRAMGQLGSVHGTRGQLCGKEILLVRTGVGGERASEAAEMVLAAERVEAVISMGFAGALQAELQAGELVLCREVHLHGEESPPGPATKSDERLLSLASAALDEAGLPFRQGDSLTVRRVVATAREKREMAHLGRIVEMESYWVGKIAREKGVPFLTIRAISDTADQDLTGWLDLINSSGRLRWRRAALRLLAAPSRLGAVLHAGQNFCRAEQALTRGVEAILGRI